MFDISKVTYSHYNGDGDIHSWISAACDAAGVAETDYWKDGMKTLCERESSLRPNITNDWDRNANGPIVADGFPLNCSRGIAQCIPSTFAAYHVDGTSWDIYDPVANIAASINYCINFYHVAPDESDLAKKVRQADPHRHPGGYIIV